MPAALPGGSVRATFVIDQALDRQLDEAAHQLGKPRSEVLRSGLRFYFAVQRSLDQQTSLSSPNTAVA